MAAIFNISGGVRYHFRGWRNTHRRWRPFRDALAGWLARWQPGGDKLLIVGPSGGYCLRMKWLANFREIVCLDPDPIARVIFSRRLLESAPKTKLTWSRDDFLASKEPTQQLRRFEAFLGLYPGSPVLFSNILGQLSLLMSERGMDPSKALPFWKAHLYERALAGRPWASFHDRVSGALTPTFSQPLTHPIRLEDEEVVARLYSKPTEPIVLADHDTVGLFPASREHVYFHWALTPRWTHLIEATHS